MALILFTLNGYAPACKVLCFMEIKKAPFFLMPLLFQVIYSSSVTVFLIPILYKRKPITAKHNTPRKK